MYIVRVYFSRYVCMGAFFPYEVLQFVFMCVFI